jgi:hypothetical protein
MSNKGEWPENESIDWSHPVEGDENLVAMLALSSKNLSSISIY